MHGKAHWVKGRVKPTAWEFAGDWAQGTQLHEGQAMSGICLPARPPFCPQHSCCKALPQISKQINNKGVTSAKRWAHLHQQSQATSLHLLPTRSVLQRRQRRFSGGKATAQGGTAWEQRSQDLLPAPRDSQGSPARSSVSVLLSSSTLVLG